MSVDTWLTALIALFPILVLLTRFSRKLGESEGRQEAKFLYINDEFQRLNDRFVRWIEKIEQLQKTVSHFSSYTQLEQEQRDKYFDEVIDSIKHRLSRLERQE